ncbi:hypothetical protein D3C80_1099090 [compost metagenome]
MGRCAFPCQDGVRDGAVLFRLPPLNGADRIGLEAKVCRGEQVFANFAVTDLGHLGRTVNGHFVQPGAVYHHTGFQPQCQQGFGDGTHQLGGIDPHQLVAGAGRVDKRPQDVK